MDSQVVPTLGTVNREECLFIAGSVTVEIWVEPLQKARNKSIMWSSYSSCRQTPKDSTSHERDTCESTFIEDFNLVYSWCNCRQRKSLLPFFVFFMSYNSLDPPRREFDGVPTYNHIQCWNWMGLSRSVIYSTYSPLLNIYLMSLLYKNRWLEKFWCKHKIVALKNLGWQSSLSIQN